MRLDRVFWCAVMVWCGVVALVLAQSVLVSKAPSKTSSASEEIASPETDSSTADVATAQEKVEVVSFSGTVEVRRDGSFDYQAAEEGMLLVSGDTIKTGAGASAILGFDEEDRNIVRVEENTTSVIVLKGDEKIELLQGEVFSIIQSLPTGTSFEVRTPTAVAGARGTEWATRYDGQETQVEAYEDMPFVKMIDEKGNLGEEMKVVTGYATRVAKFAPPARMSEIPAARRQQWQDQRQAMRQDLQGIRARRGRPDRSKFQGPAAGSKKGSGKDRAAKIAQDVKPKQAPEAAIKPKEASSAAALKRPDQGLMLIGEGQVRKPSQFIAPKELIQTQEIAPPQQPSSLQEKARAEMAPTTVNKVSPVQETVIQSRDKLTVVQTQTVETTQNVQQQQQVNARAVQQAAKGVPSTAVRSDSGSMQRR
jgi:hypothetical protein